jgi:hypothetical protein
MLQRYAAVFTLCSGLLVVAMYGCLMSLGGLVLSRRLLSNSAVAHRLDEASMPMSPVIIRVRLGCDIGE